MDDIHEHCWLCAFWSGSRCTQTWRLMIHIEPQEGGIGGIVDFTTTPGMVPEDLKTRLTLYFEKFMEKLAPAISLMPIWDEVRQYQTSHPEAAQCPGRKESEALKPYLRVVKT